MFTVLYRWRVRPEREAAFIDAWSRVTDEIYRREGSLGSRLHRADDGTMIAYAQWPSRERWESAFQVEPDEEGRRLREVMRSSAERLEPITMEVVADLLATKPHSR